MNQIDEDAVVIILPEGRMKRATGLDKKGMPMTVRGGVADILPTPLYNQPIHDTYQQQLDVSSYAKGIYFLTLNTPEGILKSKFVVQ